MDSRSNKRKALPSTDDDKGDLRARKHSVEMKDMVQERVLTLCTNSLDFHNTIDSAEDDVIRMFKFMKEKQNALLENAHSLAEEYG